MTHIIGVGPVGKRSPIIPGGNFSWGEATKDFTRLPPDEAITKRIIKLAREIQPYRERFGHILHVNSWYRPPDVNKAVGGAAESRHLFGDGADLSNPAFTGYQLADHFHDWPGGLGEYRSHIHLDLGNYRRW